MVYTDEFSDEPELLEGGEDEVHERFTIQDKNGMLYGVRAYGDPGWYQLIIHSDRDRVGYVNLSWNSPTVMQLADIHLELPYRNRGIGTALLPLLDTIARRNHLTMITGFVVEDDVHETVYLLDWYERNGFAVVRDPGGAQISRPVATEPEGYT